MARVRVIGAGLAGLGAATTLAAAGAAVVLEEAAPRAGGRCRSYHDAQLGQVIDNGNHLVLSGNRAVMAYLDRIGARNRLAGPDHTLFDFHDLRCGTRWQLAPNDGALPWWLAVPQRRTPGTTMRDHLALARLMLAGKTQTVAAVLPQDTALWHRLAEPVLLAALNVAAADGSARLAGRVIAQSLARGGAASRPMIATPTLDAAFVDPALAYLAARGAGVRFGRRLRGLVLADDRVAALDFGDGPEPAAGDAIVLAVPPWVAADLLPGQIVPDRHSAIVNAHFAMPAPPGAPAITALVGGFAEWVFAFADRISVTISAADAVIDQDRAALAARIWADVAATLRIAAPMPRWQIVKERRATFAATPAQDARRPGAATRWRNLFLAGDWVQTGLPATIEGALRSGSSAARLAAAAIGR
jgi:hydroxysqualene dehydroxylase